MLIFMSNRRALNRFPLTVNRSTLTVNKPGIVC